MNYCKFTKTAGHSYTGGSQLFHYQHHHHIIPHELGFDRPLSASFNSLFKGLRVVYVHLVYNSTLFLACRSQLDLYFLSFSSAGSTFNTSKISSVLLWPKRFPAAVLKKIHLDCGQSFYPFFKCPNFGSI